MGIAKMWQVRYQPSAALASGQHRAQIDVTDTAGNINRRQWRFYIQVAEPKVSWDAGLINSLHYSYLPLEKLNNTINFTSQLQSPTQRLTLQFQASAADYPGLATEPSFGDYYLSLDQYTFGWQTKQFALQYGNINLPFESSLLQFGLGFKGVCIENNSGQNDRARQWTVFQGTTASSFGLGISLMETTGGIYAWQTGANKMQVYLMQMDSANSSRILGFQGDRVFEQGILGYELIYGQAEAADSGGGIRIRGGTSFADTYWDIDLILLQDSYPLRASSPLPSTQGSAYQYTISGDKLLQNQKRINFAYSHLEDSLDGSEEDAQRDQSLQLNLTGFFTPDLGWLLGYQGGESQQSYGISEQQIIKLGINRKLAESSWHSNLWIYGDNSVTRETSRKYQLNIGYTKPLHPIRVKNNDIAAIDPRRQSRQCAKRSY